jgi:two-component system CheB/CheR fusion protein
VNETFPVVGVGASAGGLEAFTLLLKHLPPDTGLAIVLVQHLDPTHESLLTDILSRNTEMPIHEVKDGMLVQPNQVYVMPPNTSMTISGCTLRLMPREAIAGLRLPIDLFLRSLAERHHDKAIGVILSGTGSDGALGLRAIKAEGGITFAQDEKSAKFEGMPHHAVESGCVDFVMPPEEIAGELARIGRHPYLVVSKVEETGETSPEPGDDLDRIVEILRNETAVDFSFYRQTTLRRRVLRRLALHRVETLAGYIQYLQSNPAEIQSLYQEILINVTSFFRDPEAFETLKTEVFPRILRNRPADTPVRIWVPGSATGEEAYSIAICLLEFLEEEGIKIPIQIFATDIDDAAIERSRTGAYPENISSDVNPERLRRFFTPIEHGYEVSKAIRETCVFAKQNLISDPPFSRLDLISCRNVLIYLDSLHGKIIPIFHYALKPGGFLMLGPAETVGRLSALFAVVDPKNKIYSKIEGPPIHRTRRGRSPRERDVWEGTIRMPDDARESVDLDRRADNAVLETYGPPGVVLDENLEVLQICGNIKPYLERSPGKDDTNLLKRPDRAGLASAVHEAIQDAKEKQRSVRRECVQIKHRGQIRDVNLQVIPLDSKDRGTFLVLFEEHRQSPAPEAASSEITAEEKRAAQTRDHELQKLKRELAATREHLLSILEAHQASDGEMQFANEEALSNIEELQSINEELETAKEELQSTNEELSTVNEELSTVNEELQTRNVELSQSRDFAVSIVETVRQPLLVLDTDLRVRLANSSYCQVFQSTPEALKDRLIFEMEGGRWNIPGLRALLQEALPQEHHFQDVEIEHEFSGIGRKVLMLSARRLDNFQMILLAIEDITRRKNAEKALRRSEEYLYQMQKMEAIGRLAGGIAHDFNNLLTVIMGYSDLLLGRGPSDASRCWEAQEIKTAAEKAAALTQKLLAFSRRQTLQPKALDLNSAIADLEAMLRRLVGEPIDLIITSDPARPWVKADPGQLVQAIMNLALNARDAMPLGGRLAIETSSVDVNETVAHELEVEPGNYATLAVIDNGIGMDPETKAHIFEPFFTTKENGLGTGLGLSTVYGIVKQSKGAIQFDSESGHGTTFTIYLPSAVEPVGKKDKPGGSLADLPQGTEIILLAEDEDAVRRLARNILQKSGYTVLDAPHGRAALSLCQAHDGPIDLLITDVVMPGMGGRELADQTVALRAEMKVLFISGYVDDTILRDNVQHRGAGFLPKPFTPEELTRKVRELLDSN